MRLRPVKQFKNKWIVTLLTFCFCCAAMPGLSDAAAEKVDAKADQERDIIFIIDNSGSMKKNDPDLITKEVVTDFISKNRENSYFGMVVFGKEAELVEPLTDLSSLEMSTRFFQGLDRIDYQGLFTNTPAAVERAIYELKTSGRPESDKVIILLTDGIVDTGDKNSDIEKEKWLKEDLTRESEKIGIRIFGIAFTDKADFRLIQTLASRTGGEYFRAYAVEDIPGVLEKIEESFSKPVEKPEPPAAEALQSSPPVVQPVQKPPEPPETEEPPEAEKSLLPIVLAISLVILGAVVLLMTLKRKGGEKTEEVDLTTTRDFSKSPDPEQLHGELIDVENVMKKGSVSLPLDKVAISIGRDSSNDVVIPVDAVSSFHATIEFRNGYYYLEDHRSTNGTSLNDDRLKVNTPVRLKSGDKINFAVYEFRFLLSDQAPFGETVILEEE